MRGTWRESELRGAHSLLAATGGAGRGKGASELIKTSTSKVKEERALAAAKAGGGLHQGTAPGTSGRAESGQSPFSEAHAVIGRGGSRSSTLNTQPANRVQSQRLQHPAHSSTINCTV